MTWSKDENNARPLNCEGLTVVKLNQLICDAVSPTARTNDRKMQNIETSVVKAATILSKVVNHMAELEKQQDKTPFGELIDECNDVLGLNGTRQ